MTLQAMKGNAVLRTLWQLGGEWGRNGDKVEIVRTIMDRHLLPLSSVPSVAVALVAELVQREPAVHQHS